MDRWCIVTEDGHYWALDDGSSDYELRGSRGDRYGGHLAPRVARSSDPASALAAHFGKKKTRVAKSPFLPGQYHPRMWRFWNQPRTGQVYRHEWSDSVRSVRSLLARLETVFMSIEPSPANDRAYGHDLRQLLILGCTEVESSWRAVMKANGYGGDPKRWTTKDYVKLGKPLHLGEWQVSLTRTPAYPALRPFVGWDATNPTTTLPWYTAYNNTKHDRETKLSEATLGNTITALAAAFVVVHAQFGQFGFEGMTQRDIDAFQVLKEPQWAPEELYVPPLDVAKSKGGTWTALSYAF